MGDVYDVEFETKRCTRPLAVLGGIWSAFHVIPFIGIVVGLARPTITPRQILTLAYFICTFVWGVALLIMAARLHRHERWVALTSMILSSLILPAAMFEVGFLCYASSLSSTEGGNSLSCCCIWPTAMAYLPLCLWCSIRTIKLLRVWPPPKPPGFEITQHGQ